MKTSYQQIFSDDIPTSEVIEFEPLLPKFKLLKATEWLIFFAFLLTVGILTHLYIEDFPDWAFYTFFCVWALFLGYVLALVHFGFANKGFVIREKDVHYRTGWLSCKITSVPINRIQHLEVAQSSLGKVWNIAKLNIYTAGKDGNDLTIRGISFEKAQQIKGFLSEKINGNE